ncbi:MAG: hypothetical protein DRI48_09450 [Chloroflexi bacterium]|nr:MAG: hypothetical protein DRI48_09450 [Chloroflexota bacterium]
MRTLRDRYKNREFYSWELDPDGRVRTALKIHGTYTGRWASAKSITGSGRNLQNTPKETRVFYIPDEGYIFIEMDLSQSEARIVAALAKDLEWLREFDTIDQHTKVAALLFHLKPEDVDPKTHRQIGKRVAHASHYMLGWKLLSEIVGCPAKEAKRLKKRYFEIRPNVKKVWHKFILTEIKRKRVIKTCFNRVMQFFGPFFDQLVTDATAAEPQSTSASYLNDALARIYDEIPEFEFALQVHDSILCQVPDDVATITRVVARMKALTEQEINVRGVRFTIPAEFTIGYDWYNGVEVEDINKIAEYREEARKKFKEYRCSIANFSKTTESTQAETKPRSSSTCG